MSHTIIKVFTVFIIKVLFSFPVSIECSFTLYFSCVQKEKTQVCLSVL